MSAAQSLTMQEKKKEKGKEKKKSIFTAPFSSRFHCKSLSWLAAALMVVVVALGDASSSTAAALAPIGKQKGWSKEMGTALLKPARAVTVVWGESSSQT